MSCSSNQSHHHDQAIHFMSEDEANKMITKDELTAMILTQETSQLKHGSTAHDKIKPAKKVANKENDYDVVCIKPAQKKPVPKAKAPEPKSFKMKFDREQIREIFLEHDIDGDGYLTKSEVTKAFGSLGSMLPFHKANYALKFADADGDGLIDEDELEKLVDYADRVTNRN